MVAHTQYGSTALGHSLQATQVNLAACSVRPISRRYVPMLQIATKGLLTLDRCDIIGAGEEQPPTASGFTTHGASQTFYPAATK